ncbi:protein LURP-one-related 10-like [Populus alba x Populus x berolinensis]|uniref:Protein LURP-one-related 10-like n=1 Tax=Populus alba x Populus x berolinensis TaxID=444605 RepID=A0AAD6PV95_9ROSI|nr:protein LURP-one-related 10-like [Populus alba x Populus x berolinensis]
MNDCKVTDEDGNLIFQVRSKIATVRDIRYLQDAYGNILVSLKHKLMTAHGRWEVFRGESIEQKDLLFSVKQSSLFQLVSSKLHVFLPSNTTESVPDFRIEGVLSIAVSPNVDYAFIIVLVVILDATEDNDDKTVNSNFILTSIFYIQDDDKMFFVNLFVFFFFFFFFL